LFTFGEQLTDNTSLSANHGSWSSSTRDLQGAFTLTWSHHIHSQPQAIDQLSDLIEPHSCTCKIMHVQL